MLQAGLVLSVRDLAPNAGSKPKPRPPRNGTEVPVPETSRRAHRLNPLLSPGIQRNPRSTARPVPVLKVAASAQQCSIRAFGSVPKSFREGLHDNTLR